MFITIIGTAIIASFQLFTVILETVLLLDIKTETICLVSHLSVFQFVIE